MKTKIKGFIFYKGPSQIDGSPIMGIATLHSKNSKTGDMVQTWILNDNGKSPIENIKTGADFSVCGMCKHRHFLKGACYVLERILQAIFRAFRNGTYPDYTLSPNYWETLVEGREIRVGAYGDPFAIPYEVWVRLLKTARKHTGYTHQWQRDGFDSRIGEICMASVDNEQEYTQAKKQGMRTFRVLSNQEVTLKPREFICPATPEGGDTQTCQTCCACSGTGASPNKADVAVVVHGALKKRFEQSVSR